MRRFLRPCFTFLLTYIFCAAQAQQSVAVTGIVQDTSGHPLQGCTVKLVKNTGDTLTAIAGGNGLFYFKGIDAKRITLVLTFSGYTGVIKHYLLDNDSTLMKLGIIQLEPHANILDAVTVDAAPPVTIKEDTVTYNMSAFKVRDNAMLEDALRKMPGIDVDKDGNVTAQGKPVNKVTVNGKDFFGGDVKTATRNLPADVVQNVQIIDDYGDQAKLTGIKAGEANKTMNVTIKPDKNHGITAQLTAGEGSDAVPVKPGISNDSRYIGLVNAFSFNGDQQLALLADMNNTNVNTFSFGAAPGGGGVMGMKIALNNISLKGMSFGGGNFTPQSSGQNGITTNRSAGFNYRDNWGKKLSAYGSYNFGDNTVVTQTGMLQQNTSLTNPAVTRQNSSETSRNVNHRFTWNMEYRPDSLDYLKITPVFSYASVNSQSGQQVTSTLHNIVNTAYSSSTQNRSTSPSYGITALYNHRFNARGRNLSINVTANTTGNTQQQNIGYVYSTGTAMAPPVQVINSNSRTTNYGVALSYLEPAGKYSFFEFNYAFNHSITTNNRQTSTPDSATHGFIIDSALSNRYNYTFTTHHARVTYKFAKKKFNYTLGLGVEPSVLNGTTPAAHAPTQQAAVNIVPEGSLVFGLNKNRSLRFDYSGYSSQPTFNQLQPVIDFSNALYPVQGNPALKPQFTSRFSAGYNKFDFSSGNTLFTNVSFSQTQQQVITNTTSYPRIYRPNPALQNTYLTQYLNANGYYTASAFASFAKPWHSRRYTIFLSGNFTYTNNIGYLTSVDSVTYKQTTVKNTAGNISFTPSVRFRVDIQDKIDAEFFTRYAMSKTNNTVNNAFTAMAAHTQTLSFGVNGKAYIHKDWTVSYEYYKDINYGYLVPVSNPNILNLYVERRFLKSNKAAIRFAAFDVFNQNTGYTTTATASAITQTSTNKLGRYFLLTFTLRLQKFAGK
ncbi:MAG TPA: outer membrane beta-barrel protein [Chitinophagaceae bacterium]|nr:outer membrane beta-barrel protein [Chitinophagaceae bacterium]